MLATTIVCPNCHKALKAMKPLAVGKKVLCKQCGTTFRVSPPDVSTNTPYPSKVAAGMPAGVTAAPVAAFAGPGVGLDDEPITTELDAGRFVKIGVVALVLLGGFLLIGGGSVMALIYAARKDHNQTANPKDEKQPAEQAKAPENSNPRTTPPQDLRPFHPGLSDPEANEPVSVPAPRLSPELQEKVDKAIENGLAFVKKQSTNPAGHPHGVGLVALQGLTLLECGVPADDPVMKEVAQFIRVQVPQTFATYNVSLALLFLDRLGDAADRQQIQTLALRLVAGQHGDGGWNYECPRLTQGEEKELLGILEQSRPRNALELFIDGNGKVSPDYYIARKGENLPEFIVPGKGIDDDPRGTTQINPNGPNARSETATDIGKLLEKASPNIRKLPGLQPPGKSEFPQAKSHEAGTDNSNTQFAILAVWVAARHDIPTERALALLVKRFRTSQDKQGRWGYKYQQSPAVAAGNGGQPAMTCAGLLGLGAGYGITADASAKPNKQPAVQDQAVLDGFKVLEQAIDKPLGKAANRRGRPVPINLYFLWSLERVGVMYNVTNIGDKDWYQWGAELIVEHQQADGSWTNGGYPGAGSGETPRVDTCLALLFLKRANLAKDLSKKLEYIIDFKDLGNK